MEFERRDEAEKAKDHMDGGQIDGNVVSVQVRVWQFGCGSGPHGRQPDGRHCSVGTRVWCVSVRVPEGYIERTQNLRTVEVGE